MDFRKVEPNGGSFPDFKPALIQRSKKNGIVNYSEIHSMETACSIEQRNDIPLFNLCPIVFLDGNYWFFLCGVTNETLLFKL